MTATLWVAGLVMVVVGIAGTVLPALPGPTLVFAGLLVVAWADGFARVGPVTLIVLGVMTVASHAVDFVTASKGAAQFGASRRAAVGAAIGVLAGLFFGLPGLIIGPFVGAVAAEYTLVRRLAPASRAGFGAWLGLLVGIAIKLGLVFAMIGIFFTAMWM